MPLHAALITLLNVVLIAVAMFLVGKARVRTGIHAPAITGDVEFERVFRAHQNTLEATVMFLPALWVAALAGNPLYAVLLGYAWLVGRAWYLAAYVRPGGNRGPGFTLAILANTGLLLWGLYCVILRMIL
ncbi:MAPEG family protein [soil metagenome]